MRTCGFKGSLFKSGRCSRVGGGPGTGAHGGVTHVEAATRTYNEKSK